MPVHNLDPLPRPLSTALLRIAAIVTKTPRPAFTTTILRRKMSVSTKQEAQYQRNPHPDFKTVEASRPDWEASSQLRFTKTAAPAWKFGDGANDLHTKTERTRKHVQIDPYEAGRPAPLNYSLLISTITPRPIGFVSTRSADGKSTNLAPFSYFNVINHDPPLFVLGIASSLPSPKDTLRNISDTKRAVLNIISEPFLEAANATSIDAPHGVSEWDVSGLTPVYDCVDTPEIARVGEAVFSIECRLESVREFESRATPGKKSGSLVVLEGTRFWAREDAISEDRKLVRPEVLRPISRLGGITYGRTTEVVELPRPVFERDLGGVEGYEKLKKKNDVDGAGKGAEKENL